MGTDALTAELVEASQRVLDAALDVPRGMDPQPLVQRWKAIRPQLEELGWFDLLGPESSGGLGLPPALAVRLLRLAGSSLVPGPVVEAVLTVPWLLTQPDVASTPLEGARLAVATVDPGHDLPATHDRRPLLLRDGRLTGASRCVLGAGDADVLLVHLLDGDTERLAALPATHPGLLVEPLRGSDPCQSVGVVVLDCAIGPEHLVGSGGFLPARLRAWTRLGQAAYLAGIAERVVSLGVEHALNREQFGRVIGSFQAVQHLLSDTAVIAQTLANLVDVTAQELPDLDDDEAVLAALATKARTSVEAVEACETVLQVLGGIGFTVEHPLHHYLKRAISLAAAHGSPAELHLLMGHLVLGRTGSEGKHDVVRVP